MNPLGNLQSFIFGDGSSVPTYEEVKQKRALQQALMQKLSGSAPSTIGEGLQAIGSAFAVRKAGAAADRGEEAGKAETEKQWSALSSLFGGSFGGGDDYVSSMSAPAPRAPSFGIDPSQTSAAPSGGGFSIQPGAIDSASPTSNRDRELLAKTLMAEAGGEGELGMLAAGAVINNRAKAGGYGDSIADVILKPGQFSAWNSVTGYAGGEGGLDMDNIRASDAAYRVADALLSGSYEDPTGGATHYYNPAAAQPKWGMDAGGNWTRIGNHVFGNADAGRGGGSGGGNAGTISTSNTSRGGQGVDPAALTQIAQFMDNPWATEGQKALAGLMMQRMMAQSQPMSEMDQLQLEEQRLRLEQMRNPQAEPVNGVQFGGNLVNPRTGEVIAEGEQEREMREDQNGVLRYIDTGEPVFADTGEAPVDIEGETKLREEWNKNPRVKAFDETAQAYTRIAESALQGTGAGDISLLINYMKMLDPGSVVREGEFATAQNAGGVSEKIRNIYNKVVSGELLTGDMRQDFVDQATNIYRGAEEGIGKIREQYGVTAQRYGLDPDNVLTDYRYRPEGALPAAPRARIPERPGMEPSGQPAPDAGDVPIASPSERFLNHPKIRENAEGAGITVQEYWEMLPEETRKKWLS